MKNVFSLSNSQLQLDEGQEKRSFKLHNKYRREELLYLIGSSVYMDGIISRFIVPTWVSSYCLQFYVNFMFNFLYLF